MRKAPSSSTLSRHVKLLLVAAALLVGVGLSSRAASVGAHFVGRNANTVLGANETAGLVPQAHWNNVFDDGTTFSGTTESLRDDSDNVTAVKLVYQANDSWNSDGFQWAPDEKLMKGIIKANPNPDLAPTNNTDRMLFVFTNLPAGAVYNVIVYLEENGGYDVNRTANTSSAKANVTVGSTTYYVDEEGTFNGSFLQGSSTLPGNYFVGNYAQFDNVAPAADRTITITAKKQIETPQVNDGIGVAGIQLVQVSGPAFPANTDASSITNQPSSTTVADGNLAVFRVGTAGPSKVQWRKNGTPIAGATDQTLRFLVTAFDNNAQIVATVYNNVNTNLSTPATLTVVPPTLTQGFSSVYRWEMVSTNVGTLGINELRTAIGSGPPTITYYVPGLDVPNSNPDISYFGAKVWGWVKPDVDGDYNFFLRSDDSSQLFLNAVPAASGTNTLPDISSDTPIAQETACCNAFTEPPSPRTTAAPIHLLAGKLYGFVALYKEGGGGDFVQVAWRLTTDTNAAAGLKPIAAGNVWTLATSAGQTASITTQPAPVTVQETSPATFSVGVTTGPVPGVFGVQWLINGTIVPGASGSTFTIPSTAPGDNGKQIQAHVLTLLGPIDSNPALLTVTFDTNPPVVLGATAFPGSTKVGLAFDEALDAVSAGTAANYQVNGVAVSSARVRANVANERTDEKNLVELTVPTALNANFTVTVNGVKDLKGNAVVNKVTQGKVLNLTSTDIGSPAGQPGGPDPLVPTAITTWGPGAFDVLCNGNDYWNNADGFNFLWEPKTNSFDVKVRVVSVQGVDNWSAGAIEVREGPTTTNGGGWELSRHYFIKVDYGGPDATLDSTGNGANAYEFNGRLAPGDPAKRETSNDAPGGSVGWGGTGPGNPGAPAYPNAWIRIARVKNGPSDHLLGYSSNDGQTWSLRMDADLNDSNHAGFLTRAGTQAGPWPDVCYVGLGSTCHTGIGNNNATNSATGLPYLCWVIYRDYGDMPAVVPVPTLAVTANANGTITLTYTGVLYSSDTVNGTYTPVASATSPFTVNPKTSGKSATFYRAGP